MGECMRACFCCVGKWFVCFFFCRFCKPHSESKLKRIEKKKHKKQQRLLLCGNGHGCIWVCVWVVGYCSPIFHLFEFSSGNPQINKNCPRQKPWWNINSSHKYIKQSYIFLPLLKCFAFVNIFRSILFYYYHSYILCKYCVGRWVAVTLAEL